MGTTTRMSLEDFLALPDIDERRLELIDGEVSCDMSPTWEHGDLAFEICRILKEHGRATVEIRVVIPARGSRGDSALIPDVAYVRREGPPIRGRLAAPPHVAVEVLSPGQSRTEMRAKVDTYLAFGVESVWVVDWDRRAIDVYEGGARRTLTEEDTLDSPSVPGLTVHVGDIFAVVES
jgi:Uma2 family endonuclease